jgi:nuclear pore complex protein Nup133
MDVDETYSERGGRGIESVFAKSEQLSVSFYADLPVEVSQILKNAGAHFHHPSTT